MLHVDVSTSDDKWVRVGLGEWWFTGGISIYPESLMELWLKRNPHVQIVVRLRQE